MSAQLRVYAMPEEEDAQSATVRVRLADLLPLVTFAHRNQYAWLKDFLEDEVAITPDLYEVLRGFAGYRPIIKRSKSNTKTFRVSWPPWK